jgi:hypothetical protein
MRIDPSTFLLQHRIKLVTQKLRIKFLSLSYHPQRLVDMSVHTIAVHQGLALLVLLVLLQYGSKLVGCPVAVELVLGLQILNQ